MKSMDLDVHDQTQCFSLPDQEVKKSLSKDNKTENPRKENRKM